MVAAFLVFLLIIGVFGIKLMGGLNIEYSEGSRSGVVQKLSKKGIAYPTWEGELNLGYTTTTIDSEGHTSIGPAIFYFSVSSEDTAESVKAAERSGKRVTLNYKQYLLRGYGQGATDYDVVSVDP